VFVTRAVARRIVAKRVEEFAHLWTTEGDDWVVLRAASDEGGLTYNRVTRRVLLIDGDEDLSVAVVRRVVAEGVPVVANIPK
jgi:hypothetical protein